MEKKEGKKKKGKSRDELIAEMKALRGEDGEGKGEGGMSKFKPVGSSSSWKTVGEQPLEGEKKKRKKKKVKIQEADATTTDAALPTTSKAARGEPMSEKLTAAPEPPVKEEVMTAVKIEEPESEGDDDIFGGAGDYKGLETDSDDSDSEMKAEEKPKLETTTTLTANPGKRRAYFDDEDEEEISTSTVPSSVTNLQNNLKTNQEGQEGQEEERPMRLEALSGSAIPSVRDLLEVDKALEKEEKRKERKEAGKLAAADKKEAMLKKMTPQQRAERKFQLITALPT